MLDAGALNEAAQTLCERAGCRRSPEREAALPTGRYGRPFAYRLGLGIPFVR